MRLLCLLIAFFVPPAAQALEYLSDEELATLDGYTSSAMLKEYDDEGNVIFRRGDSEPCRYNQSEQSDDARAGCEMAFEEDVDAIMASSFQRYLDQALVLMEAEKPLDTLGDGISGLDLSVRLDDFNYNHFMCDGVPEAGIIRLEGVSLKGLDGGDVNIRSTATLTETVNSRTGKVKQSVMIKSEPVEGVFSIKAIRLGNSIDAAKSAGSIGRMQSQMNIGQIEISRIED